MSDHAPVEEFFDAATALLHEVRTTQAEAITEAGRRLGETLAAGGRAFAYGAGHSALPAQDVVYRAGGLALFNLLPVPGAVGVDVHPAHLGSALERVEGLAGTVLAASPARAGDLLVIISLSGRNVLPREMAARARENGLTVVGVTSLAYAAETRAKSADGTFLRDHCDLVIDSRIPVGDATLHHPELDSPYAPASTVVTSAVMQAVVATAVAHLVEQGIEPPLLRSGNVDGGLEANERIFAEHGDRIFYR